MWAWTTLTIGSKFGKCYLALTLKPIIWKDI